MPEITAGQDRRGQWWAIVGSSMFTGYDSRDELMSDAERDQATQRVLPCGHVKRTAPGARATPDTEA